MHESELFLQYEEIQITDNFHHVHCMTQEGWRLIAIKGTGSVEAGYQQYIPDSSSNCPNCSQYHDCYSHSQPRQVDGSVVLTKALFIMGKGQDTVVTELRKQITEKDEFIGEQTKHIEEIKRKTKDLEQSIDTERAMKKHLDERIERLEGEVDVKRRLEKDLEKARKIVGERDWKKEILGGEEE